jgi:hypothetical protein
LIWDKEGRVVLGGGGAKKPIITERKVSCRSKEMDDGLGKEVLLVALYPGTG